MPEPLYDTNQVAELIGVEARTLANWARAGLVRPALTRTGKRAPMLWTERHLWEARTAKRLLYGLMIGIPTARGIMDQIRAQADAGLPLRVELTVPELEEMPAATVTPLPRDVAQTTLEIEGVRPKRRRSA